jgi:hypothetical protein
VLGDVGADGWRSFAPKFLVLDGEGGATALEKCERRSCSEGCRALRDSFWGVIVN